MSASETDALKTEVARLRAWVADLQSGLYVNCVYCGHRYGPGETTPMADALTAHVAACPAHPVAHLRALLDRVVVRDVYGTLYVGIAFENGRGGWSVRVPDETRDVFAGWARDRDAALAALGSPKAGD